MQLDLVAQAARALERMAFVIAEPLAVTAEEQLQAAQWFARVDLQGGDGGFVLVGADAAIVREIAAGMLGIEPDEVVLDEHAAATVLELANVLGGQAIHDGDGEDSPLRIGLPVTATRAQCQQWLAAAKARGFCGVVGSDLGRLVLAGVLPRPTAGR